jgi:hypothetical protein
MTAPSTDDFEAMLAAWRRFYTMTADLDPDDRVRLVPTWLRRDRIHEFCDFVDAIMSSARER